ncbi:MAG: translation elongation factor Ts [Candidatus Harrisonbacteria bacterium]|nr:translation elongation factor Ts [Candidatus Harrisonbacteria bacterium]
MNSSDIQKLREATDAGIMDCKRALTDTNGDYEAAKALLFERGIAKAEKKAARATGAGILESYVHNNRVGVLLDLRAETDFVAHSDPFKELAHNLAMHISAMNPQSVDELKTQQYIKDPSLTIDQLVKSVIARVGENIQIERFCRYEL